MLFACILLCQYMYFCVVMLFIWFSLERFRYMIGLWCVCCCQYIDVYEMADVVQSTEIRQHHSTKCIWSNSLLFTSGYVLFMLSNNMSSRILWFPRKNDVRFALTPICVVWVYVLFMLFVFIYVYWCSTRFPYQMMFVSSNCNTTDVTCGTCTANPSEEHASIPAFSGVPVARCNFYVIFCWSLFVLFHLVMMLSVLLRLTTYPFGIFWSWCCLYFFD
jgi:hypothetical protein